MDIKIWLARDKRQKILLKATEAIKQRGSLHYCKSQVCACMGCVNSSMSFEEYEQALKMPEVQALLEKNKHRIKVKKPMTKEDVANMVKMFNDM